MRDILNIWQRGYPGKKNTEASVMSTLNILLPEKMKAFVEDQVEEGMYGSASDYIRALIRDDQKRKAHQTVERKLLEALESGEYEKVTPEFFDQLRARVTDRAAGNKKNAS